MNFLDAIAYVNKGENIRLKKWNSNIWIEKGNSDKLNLIKKEEDKFIVQPFVPTLEELSDNNWIVINDNYILNDNFKPNKDSWAQIKYEITKETDHSYILERDYLNGYGKYIIDISWNKNKGIKSFKVKKKFISRDENYVDTIFTKAERQRLIKDFLSLIDCYQVTNYEILHHSAAYDNDEEETYDTELCCVTNTKEEAWEQVKTKIKPYLDSHNHSKIEIWLLDEINNRLDLTEGEERYDSYYINEKREDSPKHIRLFEELTNIKN